MVEKIASPLPLEAIRRDILIASERLLKDNNVRAINVSNDEFLFKEIIILGKKAIEMSPRYKDKELGLVIRIESYIKKNRLNSYVEESVLFYKVFSDEEHSVSEIRDEKNKTQERRLIYSCEMGRGGLARTLDYLTMISATESARENIAARK